MADREGAPLLPPASSIVRERICWIVTLVVWAYLAGVAVFAIATGKTFAPPTPASVVTKDRIDALRLRGVKRLLGGP